MTGCGINLNAVIQKGWITRQCFTLSHAAKKMVMAELVVTLNRL